MIDDDWPSKPATRSSGMAWVILILGCFLILVALMMVYLTPLLTN